MDQLVDALRVGGGAHLVVLRDDKGVSSLPDEVGASPQETAEGKEEG